MYSSAAIRPSLSVKHLRAVVVSNDPATKEQLRNARKYARAGMEMLALHPVVSFPQDDAASGEAPDVEIEVIETLSHAGRVIESATGPNQRVSFLVIDLRTLDGDDCRQVAQRAWQAHPRLHIVLHGGEPRGQLADMVNEVGAAKELLAFTSPLQAAEIVQLLRVLSSRSPVTDAGARGASSQEFSDEHLKRLERITARLQEEHDRCRWLEEKLCRAHRMETIGRLTDGITHYFNNRITVIQGHLSVALSASGGCPAIEAQLKHLIDATKEIADMTSQLVAYNHREYLKPQPTRLDRVIDTELLVLGKTLGEQIELQIHHAADLPPVLADPACLAHIVLNLALHARDTMPQGGRITVETKRVHVADDESAKKLNAEAQKGDYVKMTIADTGDAMSREEIGRLQTPSIVASKRGRDCDVGLLLAQGLVRFQGGWLTVTSTPEVGNEFAIYLPTATEAVTDDVAPTVSKVETSQEAEAATILIVEDEDAVRSVMEYVLTSQGHNVLVAKDANEGWAQWRRRSMVIKLAIIDIKLPGGLSGFDLERALTDEDPTLPVVLTCGYTQSSLNSVKELKVGENFLPKPFGMEALLNIVAHALKRPARFR